MHNPSLPSDDRPPVQLTQHDTMLRRQLEESIGKRIYEACDGVTQALLTSCDWSVTTKTGVLALVIVCPDASTNWRVLNNLVAIATQLDRFSSSAKIRICPPSDAGTPYEISVDEIAV